MSREPRDLSVRRSQLLFLPIDLPPQGEKRAHRVGVLPAFLGQFIPISRRFLLRLDGIPLERLSLIAPLELGL